jgi:hypothetical protein
MIQTEDTITQIDTRRESLIIKIVLESFSNSTNHCLPKIQNSKHTLIRFIWIISSIFSTSICSFMIINIVNEYLRYDVVTKIRVHTEIESDYPSISFCNKNPIVTLEGRQMFLDYLVKEMNYTHFEIDMKSNEKIDDLKIIYEKAMTWLLRNLTDEQKKQMGYSLEEMILHCEFNFVQCDEDIYSEFVWFFHSEYGNCYKFNSGFNSTPLRVYGRGRGTGLNLALFIGIQNDREPLNIYERSQGIL